jgi:membrane-bound ClpP family serine protease
MVNKRVIPKTDDEVVELLNAILAYFEHKSENPERSRTAVRNVIKKEIKNKRKKSHLPNIIALYAERGEKRLFNALNKQNISDLKNIISVYGLDKSRISKDWNDKDKFVKLIVDSVILLMKKGEAFSK